MQVGLAARAEALVNGRRYEEAVSMCRRDLAVHPTDLELRLVLGRALMALHRDVEAESEMQECLRRSPRSAEAYRMLGELAFRRDRHSVAAEYLGEAARLQPDDMSSLVLLEIVREVGSRTKGHQKTPAAAAAKLPAAAAASRRSNEPDPATASAGAPTSPSGAHGRARYKSPRRRAITRIGDEDATSMVHREDAPSVMVRLRGGIGEYLVRRGALSRERLFWALGDHYKNGGRIGDAIVRLGFIGREDLESLAVEYQRKREAPAVA